jgi:hypothetical protein
LLDVVERRGGTARERILSTFDALAQWMERENPRGCGFVNAAAELPHADHPARVVVMEQKMWMRGYLADAGANAPLPKEAFPLIHPAFRFRCARCSYFQLCAREMRRPPNVDADHADVSLVRPSHPGARITGDS